MSSQPSKERMHGMIERPSNHVIVVFGATGDLAKRKLLPGLFHLAVAGLLPRDYRIIGSSPAHFARSTEQFREHAKDAIEQFGTSKPVGDAWAAFEQNLSFASADPDNTAPLQAEIRTAEQAIGGTPERLYHLAVPPAACAEVVAMIGAANLTDRARVIVEKPFGTDLESAKKLSNAILAVFTESQIFRIDHFLGKESVDNILALRFANGLFEPIWNRDHISHIQIDVPEKISIEGRTQFFEGTGTFRDMIVTHLFQVLGFVAMEPPTNLAARSLRDEKSKVFHALHPIDLTKVVRGQYLGYRDEHGVDPDSQTETFIAMRLEIDNWRWARVPFYLRSGKSMAQRRQTVTLGLKEPTLRMFPNVAHLPAGERRNEIVIDFDDPGWIAVRFLAKQPGPTMKLREVEMTFRYEDSFHRMHELEGYERLILEAMF